MTKLGLIGAGRVGRTLTALLPREQFHLGPVLSRTATSARRSVREMEHGTAARSFDALSAPDVILLAVPDRALPEVVRKLAEARFPLKKKIVIHTSRLYTSSALDSLRLRGAAVGSLQPLFVFQRPAASLAGVHCAVEGDPAATRMARRMIRSWDGEFQLVRADQKIHLGIAASIASDLFTGLLEMAVQQLSFAGLLRKRSFDAISKILEVAAQDYARSGRRSRPGPLLEGDSATIRGYLERLRAADPRLAEIYRRAAQQTLQLLKKSEDGFSFLDASGDAGARAMGAAAGAGRE